MIALESPFGPIHLKSVVLAALISLISLFPPSGAFARESWNCQDSSGHRYESSQNVPSDKCSSDGGDRPSHSDLEYGVMPRSTSDTGGMAFGLMLIGLACIVGLALYFLPTLRARGVNHPDRRAIFILNALLGWLLIPWVLALVWAYRGPQSARSMRQ